MECNNNCATCSSSCQKHCPNCEGNALGVETVTVINLSKRTDISIDKQYYICLNPRCKTIYFSEDYKTIIEKDEVKVPVWFKSNFMEYLVCYCRNIYLKDIIRAVFSIENPTKEKVIAFLEKEDIETNCLVNNPVSRDCDLLFKNAIEYALELKAKEEKKDVK